MSLSVSVAVDPCANTNPIEVVRVLEIELHAKLVDASPDVTRVSVTCAEADAFVVLRVDDPITRKSLVRSIASSSLGDVGRARLLALSIAELVSASWTELAMDAPPPVEPAGPPPPEQQTREAQSRMRDRLPPPPAPPLPVERGLKRWTAGALFGLGFDAPSPTPPRWIAGVRLLHDVHRFDLATDFLVEHGARDVAHGDAVTTMASTSLALHMHQDPSSWLRLRESLGVRIGYASFEGIANGAATGRTITSLWAGPMLRGSAAIALRSGFAIDLGWEVGYASSGVHAFDTGRSLAGIAGPWASPTLGIDLLF